MKTKQKQNVQGEYIVALLRSLWRADLKHRKEIENAANQWKRSGSFDPKNIDLVISRLAAHRIAHRPNAFRMTLKGYAAQMDNLNDRQLVRMIPYLRPHQIESIMTRYL
jgi:hypothetical protein